MWVHARMELRSGAVFPPQLLAALWIRLLGDLRDCGAYGGRGLKRVSDLNGWHSSVPAVPKCRKARRKNFQFENPHGVHKK